MKRLDFIIVPLILVLPNLAFAYDGKISNEVRAAGDYSVPVTPDLEPYASFPMADIWYGQNGNQITLGYMLPVELTGTQSEIELTGTDMGQGHFAMAGEHGDADCTRATVTDLKCRITYRKLTMDVFAAAKAIEKEFPEPSEQSQRMRVMRTFDGEPVGIIAFKHPDLSPPNSQANSKAK